MKTQNVAQVAGAGALMFAAQVLAEQAYQVSWSARWARAGVVAWLYAAGGSPGMLAEAYV